MRFFNFFKRKIKSIEPYVEKYTECDMCEHLSNCKESGLFIETTTIHDITRHFVCDKSKCLKNELPWVEVK